MVLVVLAGVLAGGVTIAVVLTSDHQDAKTVWAIFGPAVLWSFVGTGLYAWRARPESRIGALMVGLGFAWWLFTLEASNSAFVHSLALVCGGLYGGFFLHIGLTFPSGRLRSVGDRRLAIAGYLIFPLALVPSVMFAGPSESGCEDCPQHLLLIEPNDDLALILRLCGVALYLGMFVIVVARTLGRWRAATVFERQQLAPVYACALLTFALVTVAQAGAGDAAWWPAFISTALLPFAFLASLLRSHVSKLDAELQARLEELRASRARLVQAGDAERRRLERNLHDGAQSRLVALALLLRAARNRAAKSDAGLAELLDQAQQELQTSLGELRELARGIHPAVLSERGLEPALHALASRAPVPVEIEIRADRLPAPVESAAYFVVSEALTNVAKYADASHAKVAVTRHNGQVLVEVADDGVGGASAESGSGLRGLADRVAALDGTLSVESPRGRGTTLRAEIPLSL
jgi:signal transduction histidine kinase